MLLHHVKRPKCDERNCNSQIVQDQMYETAHHLIHFFMLSDLRFFVVHGLHLQWLDESFGVPKSQDYHHFFAENLDVKNRKKNQHLM